MTPVTRREDGVKLSSSPMLGYGEVETLVQTLLDQGVICTTAVDGEPLFELYSLLEALAPEECELAQRLRHLQLVPARVEPLGLYLVYVPLHDILTHLVPASSLPAARNLRSWC